MATVGELSQELDAWCPPAWAEEWDNVGLLCGDPLAEVRCCVCTLDSDAEAVELAARWGAQVLVTHHPVPFRPARRLLADDPALRPLWLAARQGLALYAAHTNLDVHPQGVNRALADMLGLLGCAPLRVSGHEVLYKLVVFVPVGHEGTVLDALAGAGAGQLGRYSHCSFSARGEGTFLPLAGAQPFIGQLGTLQRQPESRLEVLVPEERRREAVAAMLAAHPYEEVAYDLLRLENEGPARGWGVLGDLPRPVRLGEWAAGVAAALRAPATRFVGDPERLVRRVAACGGAGGFLSGDALRAGADVLLTADVGYHQALEATAAGLAIVDAGHRATETPVVSRLAAAVRQVAENRGWTMEVRVAPGQADPWRPAADAGAGGWRGVDQAADAT